MSRDGEYLSTLPYGSKSKEKMTDILNLLLIALCILYDYSELSHPAQPSRAGLLCSDGEKCYFGPQEEIGDSIG